MVPLAAAPIATGIKVFQKGLTKNWYLHCRIRKSDKVFKPEEVVRQKIINWLIDDLGLHSLQFLDDNAIKAGVLEVELRCFVAFRPEAPRLGLGGAGVPHASEYLSPR